MCRGLVHVLAGHGGRICNSRAQRMSDSESLPLGTYCLSKGAVMRRQTPTVILAVCLSALTMAAVVGCSTSNTSGTGSNTGSGGGMMGGGGTGSGTYSSVGEQIYLSGVGSDGTAIQRTAPAVSEGSLMMGGGGCGSCHGANGRGGTIQMMMGTTIKTPDITYDALIKEGFTDATIKRAIREGLDEADKPLEDAMPRWQMSDADANSTIAYLKELGAR